MLILKQRHNIVDNDGRLIRFDEWYGYNGAANEGLRIPDSEIATEIIARENSMGISHRQIMRLSGHDCFAKKPDYHGGGQAPSTAEIFAQHGLYLTCGDADRAKKIRNFRERLNIIGDERPMLQVCERCIHTLRTIPNLVCNKNNIEDIDTMGEDHIYDEIGLVCNSRAGSAWEVAIKPSRFEARMQALEGGDEWNADDYDEEDV